MQHRKVTFHHNAIYFVELGEGCGHQQSLLQAEQHYGPNAPFTSPMWIVNRDENNTVDLPLTFPIADFLILFS